MKLIASRPMYQLVDTQVRRSTTGTESGTYVRVTHRPQPVIAISRESCAGGTTLGRSIAQRLGFTCWDQELLTRIAQKSGTIESILAAVDERAHSSVMDFVRSLVVGFEYTQLEYKLVLTRVVHSIAARGSAVFVGRGVHLILDSSECLSVRVVCPSEIRAERMAKRDGVCAAEATRRIKQLDAELLAFKRHHFHRESNKHDDFDVVVNSSSLGVTEATDIIMAAYEARFAHSSSCAV